MFGRQHDGGTEPRTFVHNSQQYSIVLAITMSDPLVLNSHDQLVSILSEFCEAELAFIGGISDPITHKGKNLLRSLMHIWIVSCKLLADTISLACILPQTLAHDNGIKTRGRNLEETVFTCSVSATNIPIVKNLSILLIEFCRRYRSEERR